MTFDTHETYFELHQGNAKLHLQAIQAMVESLVPQATRCISYNMPAFSDKKIFLYFAAFKKHIGIYPPVSHDAALIQALAPYRGPKGNLSFPLDQPLPMPLIARVVIVLHKEYATQ